MARPAREKQFFPLWCSLSSLRYLLALVVALMLWGDVSSSEVAAQEAKEAETKKKSEKPKKKKSKPKKKKSSKPKLHVGGAVRFNYFVKTWKGQENNRNKGGDIAFDTFRINIDGSWNLLRVSAEYRFYAGYNMIHHGYLGYKALDWLDLQFGVHQVPFGIQKYASHNWFFDIGYYLGFEDDYDLGLKAIATFGGLQIKLAFYKNDEGSYSGSSADSARYSYDVVNVGKDALSYVGVKGTRSNEETNQANLRLTYTLTHGKVGKSEFGISGQYGMIYNSETTKFGNHFAAAAHFVGTYAGFNVQLMGLWYRYDLENPSGQDKNWVAMGAYDFPYKVASHGVVVHANIAYTLKIGWSALDSITFYNDYSFFKKLIDGYEDSHQNVAGFLIAAGPMYTYVDFAVGKNHPWIGPNYGAALAEGDPKANIEMRFNINMGLYY